MIGKVPKAGKGFKGLLRYLVNGGRDDPQPDRVRWLEVRNLATEDPELAAKLMGATAAQSRRCQSPVYHYVISWHREERPNDDMMRKVADTTCADLGLDQHQLVYVAHDDTDHRHVHIVANRIHPEDHIAWNRREDWVRIEKSLRRQSEEMGMEYIPGRHNDPERFKDKSQRVRDKEFQRDRRLGVPEAPAVWSKDRIAKERDALQGIFEKAQSWDEVDDALTRRSLVRERKGQGYVVAGIDGEMKLSALGKGVRAKELEKRLGKQPEPDVQRRSERRKLMSRLFARAEQIDAEADLAFALRSMGLVSLKQLERVFHEREAAHAELAALRPLLPTLLDDLLNNEDPDEHRAHERKRRRKRNQERGR